MPAWTDRDILNITTRLSAITPPPTPATLPALQPPPHPRSRLMRITITSTIAACLLAAASLLWLTHSDRTVSAADELAKVAQTGSAYKGWIHLTADSAGIKPPRGTPQLPTRVSYHMNTSDGTLADVREFPDGAEIVIYFPATHEMASYSAKTNEIRLGTLPDSTAKTLKKNSLPFTVSDLLAQYKEQMGRDPFSVKETPEGDLKRFDITSFASDAEARQFSKEHNFNTWRDVTIWINRDNLMTRMKFGDFEGAMTGDFTYGPPEIHDIYDLGAPRTAKVIDERLKNDINALMSRLDQHTTKGLGNYTALLASYDQDAAGKVSPDFAFATLFAAKGDKWLANQYRLVSTKRPGPNVVLKEIPPQWPSPDIAKLLPSLLPAKPTQYFIMDANHGWAGWYDAKSQSYPNARTIDANERPVRLGDVALGGQIWPTTFKTGISFPGTVAKVIQEQAHPGLLGLTYTNRPTAENQTTETSETTWWLDPARDDMPIEVTLTITTKNQPKPTVEVHTRYLEHARLPNGQWYPTHWREDRTDHNPRTNQDDPSTTFYRLQILPTLTLDDVWFTDPRPRLSPTADK